MHRNPALSQWLAVTQKSSLRRVLMAESFPPQISVSLAYQLPIPCYQLRVSISEPDSQNRIRLEIYGVAPKDKPCNLMALLTPQAAILSMAFLYPQISRIAQKKP